jgi:lipopolysaccharide heptosyltransferase II
MALIKALRSEDFDLLMDFKDTMLPFLLYAKKKTPIFKKPPQAIKHMKDRHLWKLKQVLPELPDKEYKPIIYVPDEALKKIENIFITNGIKENDKVVTVSPGARSHTKQWIKEHFLKVCMRLRDELGVKIVLIGDEHDAKISSYIKKELNEGVLDLTGKTTLKELAAILKKSSLLITNDSAPMHIAWALDIPVVAIFGPTDSEKYAPSGPKDIIIKKDLSCIPCRRALCILKDHRCMKEVMPEEVFDAAKKFL